jgi:hypothetical protein
VGHFSPTHKHSACPYLSAVKKTGVRHFSLLRSGPPDRRHREGSGFARGSLLSVASSTTTPLRFHILNLRNLCRSLSSQSEFTGAARFFITQSRDRRHRQPTNAMRQYPDRHTSIEARPVFQDIPRSRATRACQQLSSLIMDNCFGAGERASAIRRNCELYRIRRGIELSPYSGIL